MKYKLLKPLVDVTPGIIFTWNEKAKMYKYATWELTKDLVEKNPDWFVKID
ncbi:hypothetical protein LCGC14_2896150 [marine sediment metagenome]|uniref:Uncharacterized protein n=1 Tax=marine sediment metagenome TaxID=412755 RepID=A0A0F8YHJ6_9ZZZZ